MYIIYYLFNSNIYFTYHNIFKITHSIKAAPLLTSNNEFLGISMISYSIKSLIMILRSFLANYRGKIKGFYNFTARKIYFNYFFSWINVTIYKLLLSLCYPLKFI
jgi:hypothetical protein